MTVVLLLKFAGKITLAGGHPVDTPTCPGCPSVVPTSPGSTAPMPGTPSVGNLAAVVVAGLVLLALWWWGRPKVGSVDRDPLGVSAKAWFAKRRDLAPLLVKSPEGGRFVLARFGRDLVATETRTDGKQRTRSGDRGAVALIGPSRSGKTTAVVSGVLEWSGPAILSSVKDDLLRVTAGHRGTVGEVAVFDPTGLTGHPSAVWSPLRQAGTTLGAQRAARSLCEAAPKGTSVDGGLDFWMAQAEMLLSGLLFVAHHTTRNMGDVCRWVLTQDRPTPYGDGEVAAGLKVLSESDSEAVQIAAADAGQALLAVWEDDERTRSAVYATARTVVWPWSDPAVASVSRGPSIDLDWLLSGPNTLYSCAPIEDQARLAPAFGGLLNDLIKQAYQRVALTGQPLDPPLLVVIDEAGNTPLRSLPEYASTLAGLGVVLVTVWQSMAQIESAYGRQAGTILTNHLSKLFYAGLSDTETIKYVASLLGDAEVESRSWTTDQTNKRGSWQTSTQRSALAPPHALRQMRPGDALLVHGTLPPAHVRTRPYYRDRDLADRAALPPDIKPLKPRKAA